MVPMKLNYIVVTMNFSSPVMSSTFRFVNSFVSASSCFLMISSVSLIGVLVKRDTTSYDWNMSSCLIIIKAIQLAKCFEFFMLCVDNYVLPTIGDCRYASYLDTFYKIDPV